MRRKIAVLVCALLLLAVAASALTWYLVSAPHTKSAVAGASEQAALQKNLVLDLNRSDNKSVVDDTTSLIHGKQTGEYTFSNKQLAEYYMEAGVAYANLKEYKQAATYYETAPKYDSTVQTAALEGEVSAGYMAGEREQLIPALQQLVKLTKNGHDPTELSSDQYQKIIWDIQHNKPVEYL